MFFSSGCAQAYERLVDLVANLIEHRAGDADPTGVGERLDARGDVDAVAEHVAVAHLDVTEMQADADLDAPVGRRGGIALRPVPSGSRWRSAPPAARC